MGNTHMHRVCLCSRTRILENWLFFIKLYLILEQAKKKPKLKEKIIAVSIALIASLILQFLKLQFQPQFIFKQKRLLTLTFCHTFPVHSFFSFLFFPLLHQQ